MSKQPAPHHTTPADRIPPRPSPRILLLLALFQLLAPDLSATTSSSFVFFFVSKKMAGQRSEEARERRRQKKAIRRAARAAVSLPTSFPIFHFPPPLDRPWKLSISPLPSQPSLTFTSLDFLTAFLFASGDVRRRRACPLCCKSTSLFDCFFRTREVMTLE